MKALLFMLALVSISFASNGEIGWQALALIAGLCALFVMVSLYLLSYLVDSQEMRALVLHEFYQISIVLLLIAGFVTLDMYLATMISGPLAELFGEDDLVGAAIQVSEGVAEYQWDQIQKLTNEVTIPLGALSSVTGTCSFLGTTYTYPGCIGIQVPFSSMNFATNVLVSAMLAQNSQTMLLNLAKTFIFPVLLPLGLFLRCFQFTRATGGFLIAVAFCFYFIYPFSVLVTKGLADMVNAGGPAYPEIKYPKEDLSVSEITPIDPPGDCNPFDMKSSYTTRQVTNVLNEELINPLLFHFLVGGLFTNVLNVAITLSAVKALSGIFGAEVDVSSLARIS